MSDSFRIEYRFEFPDGEKKDFRIDLDRSNLLMPVAEIDPLPSWATIDFETCSVCKLDPEKHPACPIALNMVSLVDAFQDFFSYEEVSVTVTIEERSYHKETSLQFGLSSLVGIIMVSSGCPTMELLKPNVRFHLPFSSLEEMAYRSFTMYLLGQFYRQRKGLSTNWTFEDFEEIFNQVGEVNRAFSARLLAASKKDANINALVNLHCLGEMTPRVVPEILDEMEKYFTAYTEPANASS
ncbi:MAG: hypothetical protein C0615_04490 [Desulfuromonas sp.]|nr:MAG: hypothetical protein C0615_04490 [Desulfuromonas sp.]